MKLKEDLDKEKKERTLYNQFILYVTIAKSMRKKEKKYKQLKS